MSYFDYSGIIHFHSDYSFDGRRSLPSIIRAARDNHLDFLMLTDHSTLQARNDGLEGWHGRVLLIVGQEISPRFNHLLAFDADKPFPIDRNDEKTDPQSYIHAVLQAGGICFIAHPDHEGTDLFHVKHGTGSRVFVPEFRQWQPVTERLASAKKTFSRRHILLSPAEWNSHIHTSATESSAFDLLKPSLRFTKSKAILTDSQP